MRTVLLRVQWQFFHSRVVTSVHQIGMDGLEFFDELWTVHYVTVLLINIVQLVLDFWVWLQIIKVVSIND